MFEASSNMCNLAQFAFELHVASNPGKIKEGRGGKVRPISEIIRWFHQVYSM